MSEVNDTAGGACALVLAQIAGWLFAREPSVDWRLRDDSIHIEPNRPHGFPIEIAIDRSGIDLSFGEWRERCATADDVIQLLELALSGAVRVVATLSERDEELWTLEHKYADAWLPLSSVTRIYRASRTRTESPAKVGERRVYSN